MTSDNPTPPCPEGVAFMLWNVPQRPTRGIASGVNRSGSPPFGWTMHSDRIAGSFDVATSPPSPR